MPSSMPAFESKDEKVTSRRERRKDARRAKRQQRLESWATHQSSKHNALKKRKAELALKQEIASQALQVQHLEPGTGLSKTVFDGSAKEHKKRRVKGNTRKRSRTKFEEFLESENQKSVISAEDDLTLERRLGKKLKVKEGLLRGSSDGMSELLDGLISSSDILEDGMDKRTFPPGKLAKMEVGDRGVKKEAKHSSSQDRTAGSDENDDSAEENASEGSSLEEENLEGSIDSMAQSEETFAEDRNGLELISEAGIAHVNCSKDTHSKEIPAKYVAPHLRVLGTDSNEVVQVQRRIRGLLNRLSEGNVESIADEFSSLFQVHGRRLVTENVTTEVLGALSSGPRANALYAAVFAAFIAGIASSVGMDFGAKFMDSLAYNFEEQYRSGDSLAVRNLTLLLSYLYNFKLIASDLMYNFLCLLCNRLEEQDVAIILTILESCGMGLRADDPTAMKKFVLEAQRRSAELKAAAHQAGTTLPGGKRMEFMLETICEIKNNRKRAQLESSPHLRLKKWLQKLRVEDVQLRALTWKKLLHPDKKGQWWISGGIDEHEEGSSVAVADIMDKDVAEAENLLQLAASQRMNTDIRRAIFCVIMSGEDYLDAFEKILRLKLSGKQDREVLRVLVECCLQEKVFNKYYSLLAGKLCHHDKNHKFTLQYCLWDHFKQLSSMETRRIANLAHLLADLIATYSLPLSVLKVVDFTDSKTMTPKVVLHFRIFLKVLLTEYTNEIVWNTFSRIASSQELESLRAGLTVFLHQLLTKFLKAGDFELQERTSLMQRCHMAKKALANSSGVRLK